MSRTVTLRLDEEVFDRFRILAEREHRPLSNFIQTAALRYVENEQFVDEFEMDEVSNNAELNESLRRGLQDAESGRGRFA